MCPCHFDVFASPDNVDDSLVPDIVLVFRRFELALLLLAMLMHSSTDSTFFGVNHIF